MMGTVRWFCCSSITNLFVCVVGLAIVSSLVAFFHLHSDSTRSESGIRVHRRILFMTIARVDRPSSEIQNETVEGEVNSTEATASSLKPHLENLTASSSNSSDRSTITAREDRPSSVIQNETVEGEVNSTEARAHSPTLWSVPETCKEQNCAEFLSQREMYSTAQCAKLVAVELPGYEVQSSTCKFLPGVGRPPVMLISAEGSGNTWLRGLLEKATGVCTGFQWCDAAMRARGFVGEGVASGKVLVVKTHESIPKWKDGKGDPKLYDSAVFLLRNPAWSLIAERNRLVTTGEKERKGLPKNDSHTHVVSKDAFGMLQLVTMYIVCMVHMVQ